MSNLIDKVEKLGNKAYIFSVNVISFAKTLQKKNEQTNITDTLFFLSGNISRTLFDAADANKPDEIIANLQKSSTFANQLFEFLQNYKTEKSLLNEKTDLQIENYAINQQLGEIISEIKNNKIPE